VCKPKIRLAATRGDLILAFAGRSVGPDPHAVRWAGIVGEALDFASYWNDPRFEGKKPGRSARPDNIYRPTGYGLIQVPNPTHTPQQATKDTSGGYSLVFARG
jgi:hypothetical protein